MLDVGLWWDYDNPMKDKLEKTTVDLNLRIPTGTFSKLTEARSFKPHLSMNAFIIEAIERDLSYKPSAEEIELAKVILSQSGGVQ